LGLIVGMAYMMTQNIVLDHAHINSTWWI